MKIFLLLLLLCFSIHSREKASVVYVNHETGSDSSYPGTAEKPLKSFSKAMNLIAESGTVYIQKTNLPYTKPLHIKIGGSSGKPLKVIGHGAVIDLSTDITGGPWIKNGEYFILNTKDRRKFTDSQRAALFVDSIPIHPLGKGIKEKYHVTFHEDGRLKVLFPEGIDPINGKYRILLNAPPSSNGVSFGSKASHVMVEGITVKFAGNDGFNLHGPAKNITLKNVTTLFNGDEGISAHDDIEVKVLESVIAFNGSAAGGIADVDRSVSYYENCLVVNNYANAFFFIGQKHTVKNCVIWGNRSKLHYKDTTEMIQGDIYEFKDKKEARENLEKLPGPLKAVINQYVNSN